MREHSQRRESVPLRARVSIKWRDYTLSRRAKRHAGDFVGMSPEQAQSRADELGLLLRLGATELPAADQHASGRVRASVRDGVIVAAADG
jgi:hypothetical protein